MDKLQVPGIIVREVPKKCQRDWCKIQSRRINEENIIDWLFERLATITTLSLEDCLLLLLLVCAVAIFAMPSLFSSRNKHCIDAKHTDSLEEAAQFWEECQSDCLEHKCVELTVRAVQLLKLLHKKVRDMKKNSITSADRMKVIVFLEKLENKLQAMVEALTDYRTTANLHPEILLQFVEAGQAISLSKRCAQMVRETLQTDDIDAYFEKRRNELLSESKKAAKLYDLIQIREHMAVYSLENTEAFCVLRQKIESLIEERITCANSKVLRDAEDSMKSLQQINMAYSASALSSPAPCNLERMWSIHQLEIVEKVEKEKEEVVNKEVVQLEVQEMAPFSPIQGLSLSSQDDIDFVVVTPDRTLSPLHPTLLAELYRSGDSAKKEMRENELNTKKEVELKEREAKVVAQNEKEKQEDRHLTFPQLVDKLTKQIEDMDKQQKADNSLNNQRFVDNCYKQRKTQYFSDSCCFVANYAAGIWLHLKCTGRKWNWTAICSSLCNSITRQSRGPAILLSGDSFWYIDFFATAQAKVQEYSEIITTNCFIVSFTTLIGVLVVWRILHAFRLPYSKELGLLYFGSIGYFYFSDTIKQSLGERFFALTIFQFLGYGILVLLPEQSYWVVNGRSWGNIRDPVVQWLYGMLFVWICALTGRSDTVGELLTYFNISEAVNDATTAGNGLETGSKIMYELLMVSIVLSVLYLIFKKIEKKLSGNI